jgi:tight adherence protein B
MALALIAAGAVFVAVVALVLVLTSGGADRAAERRLSRLRVQKGNAQVENVLRDDTGTFPVLRRYLTGSAWADSTALQLQQAGWGLKVSEYLLLRLLLGGLAFGLTAVILGGSPISVLLSIGAGAVAYMVPALALNVFRTRRVAAINAQLAETLALISNSLRSGFAFTQSVELASKQVGNPIRDELSHFLRDVSLGMPADEALQAMADRTASNDLQMMVTTVLVQRSTGGNLSEILDNVAETVRERERIAREIRSLTASQRLSGLILSIYPAFLFVVFTLLAPHLMKVLWEEDLGRILLVVAIGLQIIGAMTIRRILRADV